MSERIYEESAKIFTGMQEDVRVNVVVHCGYCNKYLLNRVIDTNGGRVTFYLEASDIQQVLDEHKGEHEDAQG